MVQNLPYIQCGDYFIPDIRLVNAETQILGKYGRLRRAFLEENNQVLLNDLILTEKLFPYLWEIDETAHHRMEQLTTRLLEINPAPDKEKEQLSWVKHMNGIRAQAEEIIIAELICC